MAACSSRLDRADFDAAFGEGASLASSSAEQSAALTATVGGGPQSSPAPVGQGDGTAPAVGDAGSGSASGPGAGDDPDGIDPGPGSSPSAATAPKGEIVVASVGHYSGLAGASLLPAKTGIQVWARWVNDNGGINGHPVRLIVKDDGADAAKHVALVRELVEQEGIHALVAAYVPLTGQSSVDYLNQQGVPTIGGSSYDPWYATSPMHFAVAATVDDANLAAVASVADRAVPQGKTRLGVLTCAEAVSCVEARRLWADYADDVGLTTAYSASASLAQPDFTAECLAAERAGVEVLILAMAVDGNRRVAEDCRRQDFEPVYSTTANQVLPSYADVPAFEGMVVGPLTFPWFLRDGAGADFHEAVARYAPGYVPGGMAAEAWVAGLALEAAAANLPAEPTRAALREGLWALDGDDLGGASQPLRYEPDQPNPQPACYFLAEVRDGQFVSPDDGALSCAR